MNALATKWTEIPNPETDARRKKLADRLFNPAKKPAEARIVYSIGGIPICTPGNLTAITAQAKAGKTALLSAMMAATFAGVDADTFKVRSRNDRGFGVLHFDSEQSPYDHWCLVDQVIRRAGQSKPDWLLSYWLSGLSHLECRELLQQALRDAHATFGGLHSVFIDGAADLVNNVNDPGECNPFIAELHGLAIHYDCPIANVIHCNPTGKDGFQKSRGHLGSQMERKAETNLLLDKDDLVTTVWSEKQRRAPILKEFGPRFQWSDEFGMHVSVQTQAEDRAEQYRLEVEDIFQKPMRYTDAVSAIKAGLGVGERIASERFTHYRKVGVIRQTVASLWEKT